MIIEMSYLSLALMEIVILFPSCYRTRRAVTKDKRGELCHLNSRCQCSPFSFSPVFVHVLCHVPGGPSICIHSPLSIFFFSEQSINDL